MSDSVRISGKSSFQQLRDGQKTDEDVRAIVESLKDTDVDPKDYETVLNNMNISKEQYAKYLGIPVKEEVERKAPVQSEKKTAGNYNIKNMKTAQKLFEVSTQELQLPSGGMFYPNGQSTIKVKGLTAQEDDILFSTELISQNKVLHAVLESAITDTTLRPDEMLSCDRNYVLIQLRIDGFGKEYEPGPMQCENCGNVYSPKVDLSLLKTKELRHHPDENGMFLIELPMSKVRVRFRLLNGKDEIALQSKGVASLRKGGMKAKKLWSERYLLQIMEVNDETDKIFIKSFIDNMPLGDSQFFRKYAAEVEPGIDLTYKFTCPHCGHEDERATPITHKLFYPDSDI